jgi:hypothetical protein
MRSQTLSPASARAYRSAVKTQFAMLKEIDRYDVLVENCIRLNEVKGYLICVSELYAEDNLAITKLTNWRREAISFRDSFKPTFESTKRWLRKLLLDVPDRILFFVLDRHGNQIGHLGFAHCMNDQGLMEVDNVIRGIKEVEPGIMALSSKALMQWAVETISPCGFHLSTIESNSHAIDFYKRLGFKIRSKTPLRAFEEDGITKLKPRTNEDDNPPDDQIVYMDYDPPDSAEYIRVESRFKS